MRKITSLIVGLSIIIGVVPFSVYASDAATDEYEAILYEAYDNGYINEDGTSYIDYSNKVFNEEADYFYINAVCSFWQDFSISNDIHEVEEYKAKNLDEWTKNQPCMVYKKDELNELLMCKFDGKINLDQVIAANLFEYLGCTDTYIFFRSYGRGERDYGSDIIIDNITEYEDGSAYCEWHMTNKEYPRYYPKMYALIKPYYINGHKVYSYKYLGTVPYSYNDGNSDTHENTDSFGYSNDAGIKVFRNVQMYNGTVYTTDYMGHEGDIRFSEGNVDIKIIPDFSEKDIINAFCIYNDKIYYLVGPPASEMAPAKICESDMDGKNLKVIADNAYNFSNCFIYDNNIYYDVREFYDEFTNYHSYGGIYKANIDSPSVIKLVNKKHVSLGLVDGFNIYYNDNDSTINYSCDLSGNNETRLAERDDRCGTITSTVFVGDPNTNLSYYISDNTIYEIALNSYDEGRVITQVPDNSKLVAVDETYIYYAEIIYYGVHGKAYIYKYPINGMFGSDISVTIDNKAVTFDQPPIIEDDRTLVPLRAIFEALGAEVTWIGETQTVLATRNGISIELAIGDSYLYKNDIPIYLDVPAMIVNDRTLVPVRAISEAFDCGVEWDSASRTVLITSPDIG